MLEIRFSNHEINGFTCGVPLFGPPWKLAECQERCGDGKGLGWAGIGEYSGTGIQL